jgi:hypothetical protein
MTIFASGNELLIAPIRQEGPDHFVHFLQPTSSSRAEYFF